MESRLFVLCFLIIVCSASTIDRVGEFPHTDCSKCDKELCPKSAGECAQGLVPDICGCCSQGVCGLAEGSKCFNATLKSVLPSESRKFGLCGTNMHCLLRPDLALRDDPEALCVCLQTEMVCGSDNRTYETVCEMNDKAYKTEGALYLKHWGPCNSVPWITSGPHDTAGFLNQSLALDCEVKGYPTPGVHWEFQTKDGSIRVLPSDDLYVAVQVRGGPEPYMVSTWMQIVDLRPTDTGVYTCVATNSEGEARSSAKIGVRG